MPFSGIIQILTVLQGEALFVWVWSARPTGVCFDLRALDPLRFAAGLALLAFALALIRTAFSSVGREGVYYGRRLAKSKKAAEQLAAREEVAASGASLWGLLGLYRPQYVGSYLVLWALVLALGPQLPPGSWFIAAFYSLMYSITSVMEDFL